MKDTKALVLETIRLAQRLYELDTEMLQTIRDTMRLVTTDAERYDGLGLTTLENCYGSFRDHRICLRAHGS